MHAPKAVGVLAIFATALAFVAPAAGYHVSNIYQYYSGTLSSGDYRTVAMGCSNHVSQSRYDWSGPSAYGTAAIIAPSGTWLASDRSNVGYAIANVSPSNPDAYKALCKNSSTGFVWVNAFCHDTVAFSHSICS